MQTTGWQHFEHEADIGVRGMGRTLGEAFEQAALAMTAVCTDPAGVEPVVEISVQCEAPDPEMLLVDWLNALVFEMATRKLLFGRFEVNTDGHTLSGRAWGEAVNMARHQPAVEIKGATYTMLSVTQAGDGAYVAQCVVDV